MSSANDGEANTAWGTQLVTDRSRTGMNSCQSWNGVPDRILTATEAFKKCYIENDDAVKCIERWATHHTAIYADPPYYDCSHYYKEDFDNDQHARLAECLHNVEAACVIVSYYPHPEILKLYSEDDWEYHYKNTVASSAGITRNSKTRTRPKRTELLLVRKQRNPEKTIVSLSGQTSLF
jgi:site-specific DNA-adenine methylase